MRRGKHHVQQTEEYHFRGAVKRFDEVYCQDWECYTYAVSLAEARNNFKVRFRQDNYLVMNTPITLVGKITRCENAREANKQIREQKKILSTEDDGQLRLNL